MEGELCLCECCCIVTMCCVQTLLQMSEVGVGSVEVPEMCVDGSSVCLVCGDKGSGFHYSVFSCEGCKVRRIHLSIIVSGIYVLHVIALSLLLS